MLVEETLPGDDSSSLKVMFRAEGQVVDQEVHAVVEIPRVLSVIMVVALP